jgi:hypothetical protein
LKITPDPGVTAFFEVSSIGVSDKNLYFRKPARAGMSLLERRTAMHEKKKKPGAFVKAGILLAVLVFLIVMVNQISRRGLPGQFVELFTGAPYQGQDSISQQKNRDLGA